MKQVTALLVMMATGCITPNGSNPDAEAAIAANLSSYTQYGWVGGAANGSAAGQATFFPIIASDVAGDHVTIAYAWKSGVLSGTISGNDITGTWSQTNGHGIQQLTFDDDGHFISGWWADDDGVDPQPAFLSK